MGTQNNNNAGRDRPWMFRTYAGHSTARESNELYRSNLEKGQTGLSIAFDLPTQTGYDPDHILARGEVGKVGVPIAHLGDMRTLFDQIPLDRMNTSMTINATAPWLLALYVAAADEQGVDREKLAGTTQNDLIKEYLSRGTYVFPPAPSMRLTTDVISWTYRNTPKWNPMNVCSYHLQEAGATPVQELSFALATAIEILDRVKADPAISAEDFPKVVGRISFFVNAGMRFITELCKMRAFTELWDEICRDRYGVEEERYRRFRYGVQVNSLGLTEQQPENNVYRILIEMLAVVLSKNARARAVQLPAWNEALGLPRPFDQQWSLRMQQIMAYETDLLEYGDIFDGSREIEAKVESLKEQARQELASIEQMGGAVAAIETGYMKQQLVNSNSERLEKIEAGDQTVVGVNRWTVGEDSPLTADKNGAILTVPAHVEEEAITRLEQWRAQRDDAKVQEALDALRNVARGSGNIMEPSIACAKAGVTTGEWGETLRSIYGEFRAPTGVSAAPRNNPGDLDPLRDKVSALTAKLGRLPKVLVGKPGLDGHSNGAEQIAVRARDCGMEVVYEGIRLTPEQIVEAALEEKADVIGLSILSGSHMALVQDTMERLGKAKGEQPPVIVGGIIPTEDETALKEQGIAAVYTPKNFQINTIISDIIDIIDRQVTDPEA
ncbi:protein meaA [Rhodobacteraceae bacterium RKSG542]|uniref:protein meaA n=1 Tax=Pseudovibrio flavus TaxID=2529854 RepID=UPI0012BBB6E1|nr:protein meaA [Pseudovibrio flavus]MTI18336.1 protein meaA [Pseudovibrio flavus]